MDKTKIGFIVFNKNKRELEECISHIRSLHIPENYKAEISVVDDNENFPANFQNAIANSDARYKIYLQQNVNIIYKDMLSDMLALFAANEKLGVLGISGYDMLPPDGDFSNIQNGWEEYGYYKQNQFRKMNKAENSFHDVKVINSPFLASQYDISESSSLQSAHYFNPLLMSFEYRKAGYLTGVPSQKKPWCHYRPEFPDSEENRLFIQKYHAAALNELETLINSNNYEAASAKADDYKKVWMYNEDIAVLETDIALHEDNVDKAQDCIRKGLICNSTDYELYFMLGEIYEHLENFPCAQLCYKYSLSWCDNEEDKDILEKSIANIENSMKDNLPRLAIIMNAGNKLDWVKLSLEFIYKYCSFVTYELMIVQTRPSSEVSRWLDNTGIKYIPCNGAPDGNVYNSCIDKMDKMSDVLLLDCDSLLLEHSVFNLLLSLYQDNRTGISGSIFQQEQAVAYSAAATDDIKKCMEYAHNCNIPDIKYQEKVVLLRSPALLVKRSALKQCGWFDPEFTELNYQIYDLGFRMIQTGYLLNLCHSSFTPTGKSIIFDQEAELAKFKNKWQFNLNYSCFARKELIEMLDVQEDCSFRLLEIGCSCGATLLALKQRFPKSLLYGIELDEMPARIAGKFAVVSQADIEEKLDFPDNFFSCIMIGDVLEHLHNPWQVLRNLGRILCKGGQIIASVPNVMHISVISSLLQGNWTYQDAGILDRTHLRFFTRNEIIRMFQNAGYTVSLLKATAVGISPDEEALMKKLVQLSAEKNDEMYRVYQYLVLAQKE